MRTKNLFAFLPAAAALLLPCAAHAQCADFYCESFGTYDPGSNTVSGYSLYSDYGEGWTLYVSSYISDPTGNNTWIGESTGFDYVELDFSYNAVGPGGYNITAYNYYNVEGAWAYDGESDYGVDDNGPPEPPPATLTSCSPPTWIVGNNTFTCSGSGFESYPAYVESWGDDGNSFLSSSSVTVNSDSQITVSITLNDIIWAVGWIEVVVGGAWLTMEVPEIQMEPVITITSSKRLWFFGAGNDVTIEFGQGDVQTTLTASGMGGAGGSFAWSITAGADKASFSAGTANASITTQVPSVLLYSLNWSTAANDVTVSMVWTDADYDLYPAATLQLAVDSPYELDPVSANTWGAELHCPPSTLTHPLNWTAPTAGLLK